MIVHPKLLKHRWLGYVLVTVLVPVVIGSFIDALVFDNSESRINRTSALIAALNVACGSYVSVNGALPKYLDNRSLYDAISGVDAGKYYMTFAARDVNSNRELVDAWGTPLRVTRMADSKAKIESAGPDKKFGTTDDITNQNF